MQQEYIRIRVAGNPEGNSGFAQIINCNQPLFKPLSDTTYAGFSGNRYFFTIQTEQYQTVYKLIENDVRSFGSTRQGTLMIAFSVPRGYKLADGVSPYDVLIRLKDIFLEKNMRCKDEQADIHEFNKEIDEKVFEEVYKEYRLEISNTVYRQMNPNGPIARMKLSPEKTAELMCDVHYREFTTYSEVVVAENIDNQCKYDDLSSLPVPRPMDPQPPRPTFSENQQKTVTMVQPRHSDPQTPKVEVHASQHGSNTLMRQQPSEKINTGKDPKLSMAPMDQQPKERVRKRRISKPLRFFLIGFVSGFLLGALFMYFLRTSNENKEEQKNEKVEIITESVLNPQPAYRIQKEIEKKLNEPDLSFSTIHELYEEYGGRNDLGDVKEKLKAYEDISKRIVGRKDGIEDKSEELYPMHRDMIKKFLDKKGSTRYYREEYSPQLTSFGDFKKMADSYNKKAKDINKRESSDKGEPFPEPEKKSTLKKGQ